MVEGLGFGDYLGLSGFGFMALGELVFSFI